MALRDRLTTVWRNRKAMLTLVQQSHLSCSQYGEDLLFERLLQPSHSGTYVDVGAHHPVRASNTYRLYAHGWRGLTVDPNPRFAPLFRKLRPGDVHLTEGVAPVPGDLTYFQFGHDVFNTLSATRAAELEQGGTPVTGRTTIPCRPLADMVEEHLHGRHIDLLSIDCEGLDLEVLQSLDLGRRRPTVLMVEDYSMFGSFQVATDAGRLSAMLRGAGYSPIAQSGWTSIFVANDWQRLFERTDAYRVDRVQNGYLPGQAFPVAVPGDAAIGA